jgi:hypothetical protein
MGLFYSKVRCLFLPAQSGKTRKVEEEICELKHLSRISDTHSIDIFISANNRLLVHQTSARLRRDLGTTDVESIDDASSDITDDDDDSESDAVIKGNIFSWTHGQATGISAESLSDKILLGDVEMVLMCANKRRFRYLAEMLQRLTSHRRFRRDPANIYIWIDEADSSMNIWRQFENILMIPAITRVTLVSATLGRVLDKYERLAIIPYENTYPDCYRRLVDCTHVVVNDGPNDPCGFVSEVVTRFRGELCAPGRRAFIPGAYTKESHYEIATLLDRAFGFAVIIINGECKELRIPGEDKVDLREYLSCPDPEQLPAEFNQTLAKLYVKHGISRFPLAITGYLCIQRGVTFQCAPDEEGTHEGFVFDYGIIPPISDKAEAYQTMARMFGNTGHFPNYVRPTIYANEKTFAGVQNQEQTAVNLPRIVFEDELTDVGAEDFARAAGDDGRAPTDPRKTVPIIVSVPDTTIVTLLRIRGSGAPDRKLNYLCEILRDTHPDLVATLRSHTPIQFSCPTKNNTVLKDSYEKHITDPVRAAERGNPFAIDIRIEHKATNCFNCFIDKYENRLCFIVWNGATHVNTGAG